MSPLTDLGVTNPVLAAPMAGGPSTPELVVAAARAGSFGFLGGGYKTPDALADQMAELRSAGVPFGVNLFAPNPVPVDPDAYDTYRDQMRPEADRYEVDLAKVPVTENDDYWQQKVELLLADPVPVVTFTFGIPEPKVIGALKNVGSVVGQTVTSAAEARLAAEQDVDVLVVQAAAAGGHSGILTPDRLPAEIPLPQLLREIGAATSLPMIGAGGIGTPDDVAAALGAGALAVAVGTVLLRSKESGTSAPYRAALADPHRRPTLLTRAFTGRPARGLANVFTDRYTAVAPEGYPAIHFLTSPIRKAAAAAGDPERINLWAGTGYRHAADAPAGEILTSLASKG
ncbi:nitronate monooxygenase [Mycobacterium conspicuum]|jgi:NAD(P)H-dependent flavin oxidoreductase YrpB (nitropropane dioxygenase family)|uniref:Propionate 3-nitronate monooxygenase n=1 Tax=Mycobacterium conspicuum TaxID=44010 RepID=A0A1X1TMP3_9MYCO|nr:nitronate monooxygenase [Mycobacterium conspicuum]ORV45844.1 2-nitropropane dioxygenase [Mycobacterium conspicuum]BBZ38911.1 oxidoreductase [Mycobacterium conspicuum]